MKERLAHIASHPKLAPLRSELRENQRLRWLVFLVFAVFLVYCVLVADDLRAVLYEEYRPLAQREQRLEELEQNTQVDFEAYYEREQAAHAALRARMWRSSSEGLAGAELQSWLRRLAQQHEMSGMRLDLSDGRPVEGVDDRLWRLEAELGGTLKPADALALVAALAQSERAVQVERLMYSPQRGDRMTLRLVAIFLLENADGEGA